MWKLCGVFYVWAPVPDHCWAHVYLMADGDASCSAGFVWLYPALSPLASFQLSNRLVLTFEMISLEVICLCTGGFYIIYSTMWPSFVQPNSDAPGYRPPHPTNIPLCPVGPRCSWWAAQEPLYLLIRWPRLSFFCPKYTFVFLF